MRIVLDANVLVSALISPKGSPARILRFWEEQRFEVVISKDIIEELGRVLRYPRLRKNYDLADEAIEAFLRKAEEQAIVVEPSDEVAAIGADPADDRYLECALAGGAEFIVSGDHHLLDLGEYQGDSGPHACWIPGPAWAERLSELRLQFIESDCARGHLDAVGVLPVQRPPGGVVGDVSPDLVQVPVVANDVFVVIALPDVDPGRAPHLVDPFGDRRFRTPPSTIRNGRGVGLLTSGRAARPTRSMPGRHRRLRDDIDDDDAVEMIGHDDEFDPGGPREVIAADRRQYPLRSAPIRSS